MSRYGGAPRMIPELRHGRGRGAEAMRWGRAGYGMGYRRPGEHGGPGRYGEPAEFGRIGAGWGYRWRMEGDESASPREIPEYRRYAGEYRRGREAGGRRIAPYAPYLRYESDYGAYTGVYGAYGEYGSDYGVYGSDYGDDVGEYRPMGAVGEDWERMGMRDFTEGYGRYSGGSPYSYEYSERTVMQSPRFPAMRGFSRPFGRSRTRRGR